MTDTFDLLAAERRRLADELEQLSVDDWSLPSLCAGWTAHTVAAHLNLPWALSSPRFLLSLVRNRANIDKTMDQQSRKLAATLDPAGCVAGLRANATNRFVPPTMPPEAPLTDVILHGADILEPLDRTVAVDPDAARAMLGFLVGAKARRGFGLPPIDDLHLVADDVDWSHGPGVGPTVSGPALALASAIVGRPHFLPSLEGTGVERLRR